MRKIQYLIVLPAIFMALSGIASGDSHHKAKHHQHHATHAGAKHDKHMHQKKATEKHKPHHNKKVTKKKKK